MLQRTREKWKGGVAAFGYAVTSLGRGNGFFRKFPAIFVCRLLLGIERLKKDNKFIGLPQYNFSSLSLLHLDATLIRKE